MRYILLATDRSTRQTMYYDEDGSWRYNRGHAQRLNKKNAAALAASLNENDQTVIDVAVVAE